MPTTLAFGEYGLAIVKNSWTKGEIFSSRSVVYPPLPTFNRPASMTGASTRPVDLPSLILILLTLFAIFTATIFFYNSTPKKAAALSWEQELLEATSQVASAEAKFRVLVRKVKRKEIQLGRFTQLAKALQKARRAHREEKHVKRALIAELKKSLSQSKEETEEKALEVVKIIEARASEETRLHNEIANLKKDLRLAKVTPTPKTMEQRQQSFDNALRWKRRYDEKSKELEKLSEKKISDNRLYEKDTNQLKNTIRSLQKLRDDNASYIRQLSDQVEALDLQSGHLQNDIRQRDSLIEMERQTVTHLRQRLVQTEKTVLELREQMQAARQTETAFNQASTENTALKQKVSEQSFELASLRDTEAALVAEQTQTEKLSKALRKYEAADAVYRRNLSELATIKKEKAELQSSLDAQKASQPSEIAEASMSQGLTDTLAKSNKALRAKLQQGKLRESRRIKRMQAKQVEGREAALKKQVEAFKTQEVEEQGKFERKATELRTKFLEDHLGDPLKTPALPVSGPTLPGLSAEKTETTTDNEADDQGKYVDNGWDSEAEADMQQELDKQEAGSKPTLPVSGPTPPGLFAEKTETTAEKEADGQGKGESSGGGLIVLDFELLGEADTEPGKEDTKRQEDKDWAAAVPKADLAEYKVHPHREIKKPVRKTYRAQQTPASNIIAQQTPVQQAPAEQTSFSNSMAQQTVFFGLAETPDDVIDPNLQESPFSVDTNFSQNLPPSSAAVFSSVSPPQDKPAIPTLTSPLEEGSSKRKKEGNDQEDPKTPAHPQEKENRNKPKVEGEKREDAKTLAPTQEEDGDEVEEEEEEDPKGKGKRKAKTTPSPAQMVGGSRRKNARRSGKVRLSSVHDVSDDDHPVIGE